jgi:hypothetical protein
MAACDSTESEDSWSPTWPIGAECWLLESPPALGWGVGVVPDLRLHIGGMKSLALTKLLVTFIYTLLLAPHPVDRTYPSGPGM